MSAAMGVKMPNRVFRHVPGLAALALGAALSGAAAADCPSAGGTGRYVEIPDAQLMSADPPIHVVAAGGPTRMETCANVPGEGWARSLPHFELGLQPIDFGARGGGALLFEVDGACASFLLVLDSHGAWHYGRAMPDRPGPELSIRDPRAGLHQVWIGARRSGDCTVGLRIGTIVHPG